MNITEEFRLTKDVTTKYVNCSGIQLSILHIILVVHGMVLLELLGVLQQT